MKFVKYSPLIRLALICNGLALVFLCIPYFWTMPDASTLRDSDTFLGQNEESLSLAPEDIAMLNKRPLFHENRRAARIVVKPVQQKKIQVKKRLEVNYSLAGILGARASQKAYLVNLKTQETNVVTVGDTIGPWTIDEITTETVVLLSGVDRRILQLSNGR